MYTSDVPLHGTEHIDNKRKFDTILRDNKSKRQRGHINDINFAALLIQMVFKQHTKNLRQKRKDNHIVNMVIYKWKFLIGDHVLYGCPYFGQTYRSGKTCEQAFHDRTTEHVNDSTHDQKDLGLHALIAEYGRDAFEVSIVETFTGRCVDARVWADEREKHYIAEHGGKMRTMTEAVQQTLNLTSGGQGNANVIWEALQARYDVAWQKFYSEVRMYYNNYGHCWVQHDYVTPDTNYPLGQSVKDARRDKYKAKTNPERKKMLDEIEFIWNCNDEYWNVFYKEIFRYFTKYGHCWVDWKYVTDDTKYPLGQNVTRARRDYYNAKSNPDHKKMLDDIEFIWDCSEEKWNVFYKEIFRYFTKQ